ncbi:phage holin family protein [uncultured Pontibacter sp.]|uniref:phage holin family protein n=1 Tax=uncultured Pontibacter sp. TaxID=453356 RepID=UPI0026330050|nr:phage holin family protein [uncultured Pontibacter sp.]
MRLLTLLLVLTPFLSEVGQVFNKYVFSDWDFVPFLAVAITIDTLTGVYVNAKLGRIHSFRMRSLFEKLQMYVVGLIIIHGLASHLVDGSPNQLVQLIVPFGKGAFYFYMLACEAISVEENLQRIGKGYLPKWIKTKLMDYKETGRVEQRTPPQPATPSEAGYAYTEAGCADGDCADH